MVRSQGLVIGCLKVERVEEEEDMEKDKKRKGAEERGEKDCWLRVLSSCLFPNFMILHPSLLL